MLEEMSRLPLHVRCSHPPFLVERWRRQFGNSDTEQLLRWNQEPAPVYARLNRLHPGAEQGMAELSAAQPEVDDFFLCKSAPIEPLRQGWCYVQDPSTMLAPRMLAAEPGMTVLDACAAPGGKSAVIAQSMRNEGRLVACDLPGGRLRRLEENLRRLRVTCAEILAVDWLASTGEIFPPETFDGILLDAPCSNTGVMRRRVDVRWRISENEFARMTALQRRFLECCVPLLKPGGRLVYSTCSIDREENESQVEWLQQTFPGLKCARMQTLLPQRDGVDGAFAALLIQDR